MKQIGHQDPLKLMILKLNLLSLKMKINVFVNYQSVNIIHHSTFGCLISMPEKLLNILQKMIDDLIILKQSTIVILFVIILQIAQHYKLTLHFFPFHFNQLIQNCHRKQVLLVLYFQLAMLQQESMPSLHWDHLKLLRSFYLFQSLFIMPHLLLFLFYFSLFFLIIAVCTIVFVIQTIFLLFLHLLLFIFIVKLSFTQQFFFIIQFILVSIIFFLLQFDLKFYSYLQLMP